MERRGSGFKKIKDDYRQAVNYRSELEPRFYSDAASFWVILYNLNYQVPVEKVAVDAPKVVVQDEKVAIEERKVMFVQKLNATGYTKATKNKISRVFDQYGTDSVIGRSDIVQVTGDSLTAAGKLISKMKEVELLEPVTGHGKGKYRFKQ